LTYISRSQTLYRRVPLSLHAKPLRTLRFVNVFSIIEKLDLATQRDRLNRPSKKQISGFGLPPIAVTKIK